MALTEQIDKLVSRLTDLTRRDKVSWQETGNEYMFLAPLGKFIVTVGKQGSEVYGGYSFQISENGRTIDGAIAPYRGSEAQSEGFRNWDRLRELYELARRSAVHADQSVSDLLSTLEQIH
jgi:hypothetical protein